MSHQNVVEHTISTDDEEGVLSTYVPSDSPTEAGATAPPPSKIKKYAVPISVTLLAISAIAIAAVVWAPGGPGRPNSIQANLATNTRGTDTESDPVPTANVSESEPTYWPTFHPTMVPTTNGTTNGTDSPVASPSTTSLPTSYMPTEDTGSTNSTESPVLPTTNNGTDSPVASPSTQAPTTPQATATYVPTVAEIEEGATPKPTPPPLDLSWLSPTPPPIESTPFPTTSSPTVAANTTSSVPTSVPTIESTGQGSATVSTETTGPPTAADRPPAPAGM